MSTLERVSCLVLIFISIIAMPWLIGAASDLGSTRGESRLVNGSFEAGVSAPEGWHLHEGGSWTSTPAHTGARSVHGSSKREALICQSEPVALQPSASYRVDGWLRCASGEARVGVELLDAHGRVVSSQSSPSVRSGRDWRYVAVEFHAGDAISARVWFRVRGQADLDDVGVGLVATSFIGNPSFEADERGRIPFWGPENDDALLPGRRAGQLAVDAATKQSGKSSALVTATGDWFAVSSVNYPLAPWTDRYELSGWARCDGQASAQLLACWMDGFQKVVRVDLGALTSQHDWQHLVLTLTAPTNAASVRLVAVARGGKVLFDDAGLLRLQPRQPRVRVFVNQVGYDVAGPKSAVAACNFLPRDTDLLTFKLRTPGGRTVWKREIPCSGRVHGGTDDDWGWYFWRVDFSSWRKSGQYRASVEVGNVTSDSYPFLLERNLPLRETAQSAVDFFYIQRCGFDVPGWHKPCHLDDANLSEGRHLDLTGGWHSAGDYNKLMYEHGDGGVVFALLNAFSAAPECFQGFDRNRDGRPDVLDEAVWGAQFVAKMQLPETGGLRNHVQQGPGRNWTKWSAPEVHTDNIVGNADDPVVQPGEGNSPLAIGAWARLAALLNERGLTNTYLESAVRLWDYSTKGRTNSGGAYLLLSALDLRAVTSQPAFLEYAHRSVDFLLAGQVRSGRMQGAFGTYGETTTAALATFALAFPRDPLSRKIETALREFSAFCARNAGNPFGFSQQPSGDSVAFFPADMGNSFQVLSRAWASALVYRVTREPRALVFALDQMDWLMGKNPDGLCLFEGKGTFNPPRYHHRYNQIPSRERGAVPGTVPNGFVREMGLADRAGLDMSRGGNRAPSYRTNEPWLVHNMFYLLAASELHRALAIPIGTEPRL